ncbi:hypothetical protein [Agreia sp. COWG]|uniref:hypothetical protein n=1 Tax=Agreia sp. COWG TaxID=2773266 RepID=UPI0019254D82|nr:hypothetical protein [Agreia sp. COWG]CAD6005630.1 conserved exported protein of unknown function [Agreia sp. COWG]
MFISQQGRFAVALSGALLLGTLLAGCSSAAEIATNRAAAAACSIITPAIEQVSSDVRNAVTDIPIDAAAAEKNLQAAKVLLDTGGMQILADDASNTKYNAATSAASAAVDGLIEQAQAIQAGQTPDTTRINELNTQLETSLADATAVC